MSTLEEDMPILVTDTTSVLHWGTLQIAWRQGRAGPARQEIRTCSLLTKTKPKKRIGGRRSRQRRPGGCQSQAGAEGAGPADSRELAELLSRSLRGGERLLCSTATLRLRGKFAFPGREAFPSAEPL